MPADFITKPHHFSYLCSSHQKKVSDTIREQMCIHVHTRTHTPEWQQWFEFGDEVYLRIEINRKQNQKIHSRLTSCSSDDCLLLIIFSMMIDWIHVLDFLAQSIGQILPIYIENTDVDILLFCLLFIFLTTLK